MKIMFAGDVVIHDSTCNGRLVEPDLFKMMQESDIICCNLEGCIEKEGLIPINKRGATQKNGVSCLKRLKESGFNMVTLANNHIMDYGVEGLVHTIEALGADFYHLGAGTDTASVYKLLKISMEDKVVGFISIAESQFRTGKEGKSGSAWMLDKNTWRLLAQAKEECDYYFVICHCGAEELEVPLPEVRDLYRSFIDKGASAVIGHHPHVIQGYEDYMGKRIFYSLGNFAFDIENSDIPYNPIGLCVFIEIKEDEFSYIPIITEYKNGKVGINMNRHDLHRANLILESSDTYQKCVEEYCVASFQNEFRKYYAAIVGLDISGKVGIDRFVYHRIAGDNLVWDDLFIYHNIAIETNRWICERAIEVLGNLC